MLDRRQLIATGAAAAALPARAATLAVADVLARMHGQIGTPWREGGVDRIIAGDAATPVRGIATTMMATFDALKGAVAAGCNLVITHEPTFWSHQDTLTGLENDPLYKTKTAYIREHNLVVFHFHDHWHASQPIDGINEGMARQMDWVRYRDPANQRHYTLPQTTLAALAKSFSTRLGARTLRVIGDPATQVSKVAVSWGYGGAFPGPSLEDSDVLVIGEAQDWEAIAYARDLVASGRRKGLIVLGHILSEQWGMKFAAEWLKGFVTEVPVHWVQLPEPYWGLPK
jgi:putative NIF3 family GTP cyclohydrolase 1 type 2